MEEKRRKKLPKRIIALIVAGAIVAVLGFTVLGFFIGYWAVDANAFVWRPSYDMLAPESLKEIYDKKVLTDGDYEVLFEQTGLTKIGIDRARAEKDGWTRVKDIQKSYFKERGVENVEYCPLVGNNYIDGEPSVLGYLERGDILISSATHFSGFKIGHSAVVTNSGGMIYQSNQVGTANGSSTAQRMFTNRINFMVVRIKPEYFSDSGTDDAQYRQNLDRAVTYITTQFTEVPYNIFTGVFTRKDSMAGTSCAHLIWYGFKHFDDGNGGKFNLDLDSNGRLLVVPKDISLSPYVELVQTFGFDPKKMY